MPWERQVLEETLKMKTSNELQVDLGKLAKCEDCEKLFESEHDLNIHHYIAHPKFKHECEVCGRKFLTKLSYILHNKEIHGKKITSPKKNTTNITTPSKIRPIVTIHEDPMSIKMEPGEPPEPMTEEDQEPIVKSEPAELLEEMPDLPEPMPNEAFEPPLVEETPKTTLDQQLELLQDQMKLPLPNFDDLKTKLPKNHECDLCGKYFTTPKRLKNHKILKHGKDKKNLKCDHCDKEFLYECKLIDHIKVKHENYRYKCDHCHKEYTSEKCLMIHVQSIHMNIKYKCELCDQSFKYRHQLTQHNETKHEGIRHQCDFCHMSFAQRKSLRDHVKARHEMIKDKACEHCGMAFSLPQTLHMHKKRAHPEVMSVKNRGKKRG